MSSFLTDQIVFATDQIAAGAKIEVSRVNADLPAIAPGVYEVRGGDLFRLGEAEGTRLQRAPVRQLNADPGDRVVFNPQWAASYRIQTG